MLLDLVIKSVHDFQDDCLKLCESHYPTVHNRGMSEHHMSLAFARRMQHTFEQFGQECVVKPLETTHYNEPPLQYRITSAMGTVWVISNHMVSASPHYRDKLFTAILQWQSEYGYAIQPNDLLFLVSDHWISRSKASRELLYWWMGELPDHINEYTQQGISLYTCESQLVASLEQHFAISPCFLHFGHPLRRSDHQQLVRKYLQLYAVLQW